jgi:uncharacterized membrane protein
VYGWHGRYLREVYGPLSAFFLTFLVIGVFWIEHHSIFSRVRRITWAHISLNVLVLATPVGTPMELGPHEG